MKPARPIDQWFEVLPAALLVAFIGGLALFCISGPPLHAGHLIITADLLLVLWIVFHDVSVPMRDRLVLRPWFRSRTPRRRVSSPPQPRPSPRVPVPAHRMDGRIKRVGERTYERIAP